MWGPEGKLTKELNELSGYIAGALSGFDEEFAHSISRDDAMEYLEKASKKIDKLLLLSTKIHKLVEDLENLHV